MLQGSCPSRTAPDFVLERTKSGDVRKMQQFTHVMYNDTSRGNSKTSFSAPSPTLWTSFRLETVA